MNRFDNHVWLKGIAAELLFFGNSAQHQNGFISHLHSAADVGVHSVADDGDFFIHYGEYYRSTYHLRISLILRMYCDREISEKCLRSRSRYHDLII